MLSFIDKLKTNISDKNSNLCVGLDIDKKYFHDDVSIDELMDIENMDEEKAGKLIMEARAPWFEE